MIRDSLQCKSLAQCELGSASITTTFSTSVHHLVNADTPVTRMVGDKTEVADLPQGITANGFRQLCLLAVHIMWHGYYQMQASTLTGIFNNKATLGDRLSAFDAPAPVSGQKHLHFWRLQLMERPVHNTVKSCQLCLRFTNMCTHEGKHVSKLSGCCYALLQIHCVLLCCQPSSRLKSR